MSIRQEMVPLVSEAPHRQLGLPTGALQARRLINALVLCEFWVYPCPGDMRNDSQECYHAKIPIHSGREAIFIWMDTMSDFFWLVYVSLVIPFTWLNHFSLSICRCLQSWSGSATSSRLQVKIRTNIKWWNEALSADQQATSVHWWLKDHT